MAGVGRAPGRLQTGLRHTAQRGRGRDTECHSGAVSAWQGAWCTKTPTVTGRVKARRTRERLCSQPSVSSLSRDGGRPLTQGKTGISSRAGPGLRGSDPPSQGCSQSPCTEKSPPGHDSSPPGLSPGARKRERLVLQVLRAGWRLTCAQTAALSSDRCLPRGPGASAAPVSYTHLTLPTRYVECRSRWSPYH